MPEFTAKDVQALRQATGAEAAKKLLREKGLVKADDRAGRANAEGAIAVATATGTAALVELKCETDFVAKSDAYTQLVQDIADAVATGGEGAVDGFKDAVDDLKLTLKENIEIGRVARLELQEGRGVNGVVVVLTGGTEELAHDVAIHIAFAKPQYLRREDVPEDLVAEERETLTKITLAEGKPEAALPKILEGRMTGWYKERVLLEQPFARDEKQSISQLVESGGAQVRSFAQLFIGG
jgi:elongation factor Ts